MNPLRKCISLQTENDPDHLAVNGLLKRDISGTLCNYNFINQSEVTWIKLWVYWDALQPFAPPNRDASWAALNLDFDDHLTSLDEQIQAANLLGKHVILTCERWAPWANDNPDLGLRPFTVPSDRSTTGPWAWFITYLLLRYTGHTNPVGPHAPAVGEDPVAAQQGNPKNARVHALEIVNEPNQGSRHKVSPTENGLTMECALANMIPTADALAHFLATTSFPDVAFLLAPATADIPGTVFTEDLLSLLNVGGFRAAHKLLWSHHNYRDTRLSNTERLDTVYSLLGQYPWTGRPDRRQIWLTEGGCEIDSYKGEGTPYTPPGELDQGAAIAQALLVGANWESMKAHPGVYLWTQHQVNDAASNRFQAGLFNDFIDPPAQQGTIRPVGIYFRDTQGGSSTP
jgi:hypothetical protein